MKKVVISGTIALITLVMLVMQLTVLNNIKMFGAKANLFLILLSCLVVYTNKRMYYPVAILTGLVIDLIASHIIGITSFSMLITVILVGFINKVINKKNMATFLGLVAISTIIYEFVFNIIRIGIGNVGFDSYLLFIVAMEVVFNLLVSIGIYPLIKKVGEEIYPEYKKNNILTKYF